VVQERTNALIEFAAQAADLAFGHPVHAQRLDQVFDRAGGDALHVGFLEHGGEGLFSAVRRGSRNSAK
jgi:hypothetical protein